MRRRDSSSVPVFALKFICHPSPEPGCTRDSAEAQPESIHRVGRRPDSATKLLSLPRLLPSLEEWKTSAEVVEEIDRLIGEHTEGEIAEILNARGFVSGQGKRFNARECESSGAPIV